MSIAIVGMVNHTAIKMQQNYTDRSIRYLPNPYLGLAPEPNTSNHSVGIGHVRVGIGPHLKKLVAHKSCNFSCYSV